jgi:D-alanine-D-alanine ligase
MRTVVGVVRGGPSGEYDVSLKTGAAVLAALDKEKYDARDIFVDREGRWHLWGAPASPERALREVDVVFNAAHGEWGEDGALQAQLEALRLPYTGSGAFASALAFNKQKTRDIVAGLGLKVARGVVVKPSEDAEETARAIFRSLPHPAMVKPVVGGSSLGAAKVEHFHALPWALERAWERAPQALVEEFISGAEATVGVIEQFRNEKLYALMPAQIILPAGSPFYDFEAKYAGSGEVRVPARFARETKEELQRAAQAVHAALGLSHYSRSDFVVSPRGIYFLEVNALPDLAHPGRFSGALQAVGASLTHFLDHVIALARKKK